MQQSKVEGSPNKFEKMTSSGCLLYYLTLGHFQTVIDILYNVVTCSNQQYTIEGNLDNNFKQLLPIECRVLGSRRQCKAILSTNP